MTASIFYINSVIPTERLVRETRTILDTTGVVVKGWDGTGEPIISLEEISFNGDADTNDAESIFAIGDNEDAEGDIDTQNAPYTVVVAAVLVAAVLDGNGRVGYTGDRTLLSDGIDLYEEAVDGLSRDERKFVLSSITNGQPV